MEKLRNMLEQCLGDDFVHMIISNPRKADAARKVDVRPFEERGKRMFQFAEYRNHQVFHRNLDCSQALEYTLELLMASYRQMELSTTEKQCFVLVSKRGKVTIKSKAQTRTLKIDLTHNRKKQYLLPENKSIPFLVELGVQTPDGKIRDKKFKKFRQINRFLEFVQDVLPELPNDRPVTIVDFGCGKSYLTFAIYYFLKIQKGYQVRMIGLDLKADVIRRCNELAEKFGYQELTFLQGDIGSYDGVDKVDLVVTLHACDTATDFALEKAVRWGARVILSVPCCQHEVNGQIESELLQPLLKYGIVKERVSALVTDAIRANLLEQCGYAVQILEFIDMEHTPKNLLIRAVRTDGKPCDGEQYQAMCRELALHTTLEDLLKQNGDDYGKETTNISHG